MATIVGASVSPPAEAASGAEAMSIARSVSPLIACAAADGGEAKSDIACLATRVTTAPHTPFAAMTTFIVSKKFHGFYGTICSAVLTSTIYSLSLASRQIGRFHGDGPASRIEMEGWRDTSCYDAATIHARPGAPTRATGAVSYRAHLFHGFACRDAAGKHASATIVVVLRPRRDDFDGRRLSARFAARLRAASDDDRISPARGADARA